MSPSRIAVCVAVTSALSALAARSTPLRRWEVTASRAAAPAEPSARALDTWCPPRTLPDEGVCVPVPDDFTQGSAALDAVRASHRDKAGMLRHYDQIPRRPDRPSDYRRYRYPVDPLPNQDLVVSGYDLDKPDHEQRRGEHLSAVGHGGVDLAQRRGAEVRLIALEHQRGDAELIHAGTLFGTTVVTRHTVVEAGQQRDYLMLHGHLDGTAPGLVAGASLREGALLGFVGDSGAPGDVHLHLELRRLRDGVSARSLAPGQLAKTEHSVVCDPRNVLPLR